MIDIEELLTAYKKFPEWFTTQMCPSVQCYSSIETFLSETTLGTDNYTFFFTFKDMKMKVLLTFDRFKELYLEEGQRSIRNTYFILSDKIYHQFEQMVHDEFQKTIKGINYYE